MLFRNLGRAEAPVAAVAPAVAGSHPVLRLLLIILIVILICGLGGWGYYGRPPGAGWSIGTYPPAYYGGGIVWIVLIIVLLLFLTGQI